MLRSITSRISSAHVIATIALFAALGGGYATAFSGSGTLQKAAEDGIASVNFENIRTLNGFGVLQARCDTVEDEIEYRFNNTTSKAFRIDAFSEDGGFASNGGVNPGQTLTFQGGSSSTTWRFHLWKETEGVKAQADMVATNDGPFVDNCQGAQVRVLALNTQE